MNIQTIENTGKALENMLGWLTKLEDTFDRLNTAAQKRQILDVRSWMLEKGTGTNQPKAA